MKKAPIQLRILDEVVSVDAPPECARLDEMLPPMRALDDRFAAAAIRRNGQPVTCVKGCSACCRIQAVPVTPVEAYALLLLVERLHEPRRTLVLSRFAASAARLHAAGLAEGFLEGLRPHPMKTLRPKPGNISTSAWYAPSSRMIFAVFMNPVPSPAESTL